MKLYQLLFILFIAQGLGACKKGGVADVKPEIPGQSLAITEKLKKNTSLIKKVTFDTLINLHAGVKQNNIRFLNQNDKPIAVYILEIDLNNQNVGIHASIFDENKFMLKSVSEIALREDKPGNRVIAAVNGDYFYWTGEPWGPVVKNGSVIRSGFYDSWHGFFGMTKERSPVISGSNYFASNVSTLQEAIGGTERLIKSGLKVNHKNTDRHPRTIVGYTAKNIVYIVVIDGRQSSHSIGMTLAELSELMYALGCSDALNLDGGGSSTLVIKNKNTDVFEVINKYSDAIPRKVSNALSILSLSEN